MLSLSSMLWNDIRKSIQIYVFKKRVLHLPCGFNSRLKMQKTTGNRNKIGTYSERLITHMKKSMCHILTWSVGIHNWISKIHLLLLKMKLIKWYHFEHILAFILCPRRILHINTLFLLYTSRMDHPFVDLLFISDANWNLSTSWC